MSYTNIDKKKINDRKKQKRKIERNPERTSGQKEPKPRKEWYEI